MEWALLMIALALGAGLRFWKIGALPPGLYQDEAYNGLDALGVIAGERPLYFTANNGREPVYIYLAALGVGLFGRTPLGVRLPAAILGTLTIPAAYALARALFGRRVGLLAAIILAFSFWPLTLSRVGFRAVSLPLGLALAAAAGWHGFARRRPGWIALSGALYGLTFYTYLAARFTPVALIAFVLYSWIGCGRAIRGRRLRINSRAERTEPSEDGCLEPAQGRVSLRKAAIWWAASAVVVIAPLAAYALANPDIVLARAEQVSVFAPGVNQGDLADALSRQSLAGLGMFFWRGDAIGRHNLPGRPVFDPLMAAAFLLGAGVCLRASWQPPRGTGPTFWPRREAAAFALIWLGAMLLPTALAADAPHFLRAAGVLPMACVLPAIGVDTVMRWFARRGRSAVGLTLAGLTMAASLGWTARDYFWRYARDPETGYLFQSAATSLAQSVNASIAEGATAYVDWRLWDNFASLRFQVAEGAHLKILRGQGEPSFGVGGRQAIYLWPYEDPRPVLSGIPAGKVVAPSVGPLARGDLEPQPYSLYSAYQLYPDTHGGEAPLAEFEGGFRLRAATVSPTPDGLALALIWQSALAPGKDFHVFVQALAGGQVLAQADGPLGLGLYPARWWRAGEVVRETRSLLLPPGVAARDIMLSLGLYDPTTGARLPRADAAGDSVEITP